MTREEAEEFCEGEEGVLFCDGYDDCILGMVSHPEMRVVYNADKMLQSMIEDEEMEMEFSDALEHLAYNIEGAYLGPHTPLYVYGVDNV
jgi:hypothetical protein